MRLTKKIKKGIIKVSQMFLNNTQNFDILFNGLENLKNFILMLLLPLKNSKKLIY